MNISGFDNKKYKSRQNKSRALMWTIITSILILISVFFIQLNSYGPSLFPDSVSPYTTPSTKPPAQTNTITPPIEVYDVNLRNIDSDLGTYNLYAQRSWRNTLNDPKTYFKTIKGKIKLNRGEKNLKLNAKEGIYNNKERHLHLYNNVRLNWSNLYHLYSNDLHIDVRSHTLYVDKSVHVSFPKGYINAGKLTITQSGSHIVFNHGVHLHFAIGEKKYK